MTRAPKILAFAGSLRAGSFNRKILTHAIEGAVAAGGTVDVLELRELPLPLFDADLEAAGRPENAGILKERMKAADALLIASPEYNSSVTAAWKNAIDWASRPAAGEAPLAAFKGRTAALCAASPGALGGLRGLVHARAILGNLGVLVIPEQVAVPKVDGLLGADGRLTDEPLRSRLEELGGRLVEVTRRLLG
jgi:NAD(P)H-dependent FMN reductase